MIGVLNKRYLFFAAASLFISIMLCSYNKPAAIAVCSLASLLTGVTFFQTRRIKRLPLTRILCRRLSSLSMCFGIVTLFLITGTLLYVFITSQRVDHKLPETTGTLQSRVINSVAFDGYGYITVDGGTYITLGRSITLRGKTRITVSGDFTPPDVGDTLTVYGNFLEKNVLYSGRPDGYAYTENLRYEIQAYASNLVFTKGSPHLDERLRANLKTLLCQGMGETQGSVAYAVLTGDSSNIPAEILDSFRTTGIAHIFAVSGLHVGFITAFLNFVFKKFLRLNAYFRTILISAALVAYNLFCGMSPSILRASVMFEFLMIAKCAGGKYDSLTALSAAFLLIVLVSPLSCFYVGFLMSFGALLSILFLNRPLMRLLRFLPKKIASLLSMSASAQLGTTLIGIHFFGSMSLYSIPVNIIVIPLFSVLFIVLLLSSAATMLFPAAVAILYPVRYGFVGLIETANFIAHLKYAQIIVYSFGISILAIYAAAFLISDFHLSPPPIKRISCLVCVVLFLSFALICEYPPKPSENRITVFSSQSERVTFIETRDGKRILTESAPTAGIHSTEVSNYLRTRRIREIDSLVLTHGGPHVLDTLSYVLNTVKLKELVVPFSSDQDNVLLYDLLDRYSDEYGFQLRFILASGSDTIADTDVSFLYAVSVTEDPENAKLVYAPYLYALLFPNVDGLLLLSHLDEARLASAAGYYAELSIRTVITHTYASQIASLFRPNQIYSFTSEPYVNFERYYSAPVFGMQNTALSPA